MYLHDKIAIALKVYHQCRLVTTTIRFLDYPIRRALYTWIGYEGTPKLERKQLKNLIPGGILVILLLR